MSLIKHLQTYRCSQFNSDDHTVEKFNDFHENFKDKSPSCFSRDLLEGHFTASAFIIRSINNKIYTLLMHHRKLGIWIQPGGHADENNNLLEVATTEVLEETGLSCNPLLDGNLLDIDINNIPQYGSTPEHLHYDARYLFQYDGDGSFVVNNESNALAWRPIEEVINDANLDLSLRQMAKKAVLAVSL